MTPRTVTRYCLLLALVAVPVLLVVCNRGDTGGNGSGGGDPQGAPQSRPQFWSAEAQKDRYGFEEWYGDFPYPPPVPEVWKAPGVVG